MIAKGQAIALADLQALATLANAKLAPATPYVFPAFAGSDKIKLPADLDPEATYGVGSFSDGAKVTLRLYGYKTIAGTKYYTLEPIFKAFVGESDLGAFTMVWTWISATGPAAPEGYIVVIPQSTGSNAWQYAWRDIGNVQTFAEDGSFSDPAWKFDTTLDADNNLNPAGNLPCGRGAWLKAWNRIRNDLFTGMDLFGGSSIAFTDDFLVSGPWCVSVAPKCYLKLTGVSIYKNLEFIYSEADSLTGNELAPEADCLATYIGVDNGVNNFNWDANVVVNGRIRIFSSPFGQSESDWVVSASHPGITISFDPHYFDGGVPGGRTVTAFIFDFVDVQYTVGTPIVLTVTPPPLEDVIDPGDPAGNGGRVDAVFTGDAVPYATDNSIAIHPGSATVPPASAKAAHLPNSLGTITLTAPAGGTNVLESHHRAFCTGVFVANTLPTAGLMTWLDVDLPQYNPQPDGPLVASSQRGPRNALLPYMASGDDLGGLWPVFRDLDFAPDSVVGKPVQGSFAWRNGIATKAVQSRTFTDAIPPYEPAEALFNYSIFVTTGAADVRFLAKDPNVVLYAKAGTPPTLDDFDASAPGGTWLSLATSVPGFPTGTFWFYSIYNPTTGTLTVTTTAVLIQDGAAPNGTFFPTGTDDNGAVVPLNEGLSYYFSDPQAFDARPIPLYGYCVYSINVGREPVNGIAPSIGTAALDVKIGLMKGFGFGVAGVFTPMQTITIPASQASIRVDVFWPVLAGTPLAYQCGQIAVVKASVNFQPIMHSRFSPATRKVFGGDYTIGYYNGPVWYQHDRALLFFKGGDPSQPLILPIVAPIYNDLTAALNLL